MNNLINYANELTFKDLPGYVIEYIKIHILDTLGAIIAGSSAEVSKKLLNLIIKWGGRKEGTIFVYRLKVPLPNAAWMNSTMSRGFDFESILGDGATHIPACIIPAAFAIAEYSMITRNTPISGKDFIIGIALGLDLGYRLRVAGGEATAMGGGWLAETFSPIAIAAMGAKMLNFDDEKSRNAIGIAYNQCCGTYGATVGNGGGLMAQLSQGLGTKAGIISLILADEGFTASKDDVIEGKWGLYKMYGNGYYNRDILLGNLGKSFDHLRPIIKKYPGCGGLQSVIHTALNLYKEHNLKIHEISRIKIYVNKLNYLQLAHRRSKPSTTSDILWNGRFIVAVALARKQLFVGELDKCCLEDPEILEIYSKIEIEPDESLEIGGVEIEIKTKDGRRYFQKGSPLIPMSLNEVVNKFKRCCLYAAKPYSEREVNALIDAVFSIEKQSDVTIMIP
ncbi:MAG: MmgE/PrpD family protein [Nitrososphaerota archaeon]